MKAQRLHLFFLPSIFPDVESVLGLLGEMQTKMKQGQAAVDDPRLANQVNDELNTLLSVLSNPMFQRICKIKVNNFLCIKCRYIAVF